MPRVMPRLTASAELELEKCLMAALEPNAVPDALAAKPRGPRVPAVMLEQCLDSTRRLVGSAYSEREIKILARDKCIARLQSEKKQQLRGDELLSAARSEVVNTRLFQPPFRKRCAPPTRAPARQLKKRGSRAEDVPTAHVPTADAATADVPTADAATADVPTAAPAAAASDASSTADAATADAAGSSKVKVSEQLSAKDLLVQGLETGQQLSLRDSLRRASMCQPKSPQASARARSVRRPPPSNWLRRPVYIPSSWSEAARAGGARASDAGGARASDHQETDDAVLVHLLRAWEEEDVEEKEGKAAAPDIKSEATSEETLTTETLALPEAAAPDIKSEAASEKTLALSEAAAPDIISEAASEETLALALDVVRGVHQQWRNGAAWASPREASPELLRQRRLQAEVEASGKSALEKAEEFILDLLDVDSAVKDPLSSLDNVFPSQDVFV